MDRRDLPWPSPLHYYSQRQRRSRVQHLRDPPRRRPNRLTRVRALRKVVAPVLSPWTACRIDAVRLNGNDTKWHTYFELPLDDSAGILVSSKSLSSRGGRDADRNFAAIAIALLTTLGFDTFFDDRERPGGSRTKSLGGVPGGGIRRSLATMKAPCYRSNVQST